MPDAASPLQRWVVSQTLWLILALPAVGFGVQTLLPRDRGDRARIAALATLCLSLAAVVIHVAMLARAGASAMLLDHVAQGPRIGRIIADLDLRFDPLTAGACLLSTFVALVAAGFAPEKDLAWIHLALLGALVEFMADDLLVLAMSASLCVAALAWLAGRRGPSFAAATAVRGAAGIGALLVGVAMLHGGLGDPDDSVAREALPAFEAHPLPALPARSSSSAGASLTMTSPSGATVFLDEGRTPLAQSPFEGLSLVAGTHVLRVRMGPSSSDAPVGPLVVGAGDALALVPTSPPSSIHGIGVLRATRDEQLLSPPLVRAVLVAWLIAAGALSAWGFPVGAPHAMGAVACVATSSIAGPFLLVRASQVLAVPPQCAQLFVAGGAVAFAVAVRRSLSFEGERRWLSFVAGAPAGLTTLALGTGGAQAAVQVMLGCALVAAAVHVHLARRRAAFETMPGETVPRESLFLTGPARMGELVASMDRWVVGAALGAGASTARVVAWVIAWQDEHAMGMPATAAARRLVGIARGVEPIAGAPIGRVVWGLLALVAAGLLAHGLWPGFR